MAGLQLALPLEYTTGQPEGLKLKVQEVSFDFHWVAGEREEEAD